MKTIYDSDFQLNVSDYEFNYQSILTVKLDDLSDSFGQEVINQIVLWKVNRYAELNENTFSLINNISPENTNLDENLTRNILVELLNTRGLGLPMASTILRFKNPEIYQIIDQRVYRIIYGKSLKLSTSTSIKNIQKQIDLYFEYLLKLRSTCNQLNIPFRQSDRILYKADKRLNKSIPLNNY